MSRIEQTQAALGETVVFVALELSKSAWVLAAQASPSGKTSSPRLDGGDIAGLLALLHRLQAREQRTSGREVEIVLGSHRHDLCRDHRGDRGPPQGVPAQVAAPAPSGGRQP